MSDTITHKDITITLDFYTKQPSNRTDCKVTLKGHPLFRERMTALATHLGTFIESQVTRPLVVEYHYVGGDIGAYPYEGESVFDLFPTNPDPRFTHLVIRAQTPEEAAT